MSGIRLSYILTTFNKAEYLRITLPLLISARQADEEIVVVDGGSKDGSPEYLRDCLEKGLIQQFCSEPDKGEAHGLNKAILMAKGELVKIVTDDDLFDFELIKLCREYMLSHSDCEVLGFDGYSCRIGDYARFEKTAFIRGYRNWQEQGSAFLFCGLSLLFRRQAIPYLGLFSCAYKIVDMEYTLRVSALQANIVFCDRPGFINMVNPDSNSIRYYEHIRREYKFLKRQYNGAALSFHLNNPILRMKERLHRLLPKNRNRTITTPEKKLQHYLHLVQRGTELFSLNMQQKPNFLAKAT